MAVTHLSIFQWRYFETLNLQFTRISPNRVISVNFVFSSHKSAIPYEETELKKKICDLLFVSVGKNVVQTTGEVNRRKV